MEETPGMRIMAAGARPWMKARAEWFTGTVWQEPIVEAPEPARVRALRVAFEPGARTAWHTHPLGQTLYVLSGVGLVALRGETPQVIRAGDTVWIPPGAEHWHGAAPETGMTHIAIQEAEGGRVADWLEHVSDEDYLRQEGAVADWLEEVTDEASDAVAREEGDDAPA